MAFDIKQIGSLALKVGRFNAILIVTVISILLSVIFTILITLFTSALDLPHLDWRVVIGTAITVPLLVAPIVSYGLIDLLFKIHKLEAEMRDLATTDSLTGLLNRNAIITRADQLHQLAQRELQPLVMFMLDLDYFKKINDQYGHAAGDKVLKEFGLILKQNSRASDLVGRIGGEEFLFFMFGETLELATFFTERIHAALREKVFEYEGRNFYMTASIGVTNMPSGVVVPLDELLCQADKALYKAKNAGRNQTALFAELISSHCEPAL